MSEVAAPSNVLFEPKVYMKAVPSRFHSHQCFTWCTSPACQGLTPLLSPVSPSGVAQVKVEKKEGETADASAPNGSAPAAPSAYPQQPYPGAMLMPPVRALPSPTPSQRPTHC